jgi:predicted metal-dependent hydrolase
VSESHIRGELLKSRASSAIRVLKEREEVARRLADAETTKSLRQVVKPNSLSRTLRKAGVALILAPDPITAVPGAMMLGASFAMRGRQPLSPASVFEETRKLLAEMGSIV